ncbi:probable hexosyltransferase MUCI70 [Corylus avellana]|uniref:probable hexosyltransferase MUCI70 n=1 Tax=Corylus avellana TaxID=13451 RepID=UPI001E236778|nr:probable hexosyltransferase MUCI70 [Corylus avellana]XP_059450798.1 probable hexosyltransferase MUCI70 [Corylus avellana]XP_059450807.1 probable hexosyltransferase MUCI70 [Corylus avellana]
MFNHHTISITVSDEESDDRSRLLRALRKRRKRQSISFRSKTKSELLLRVLRKVLRWWVLILFVPAIGLLLLEVSRVLGKDPGPDPDSAAKSVSGFGRKSSVGNLDRLDPRTRVVHRVRERCLKILPPEELEHLEIPSVETPNFPVNRVVYISETDGADIHNNTSLLQQHTNATRFNLFTGYQTIQEREGSYKVNQTAVVHCGFYSENGGFKISDEDKRYMESCKVVVSTCAFGGGDDLYQPIGMSESSLRKVCYVAFWDEITLRTQESDGHRIGEDHMIGKWRIVVVKQLPFVDQRLNGKIPKMLGHRLFPQARYSIWVDSKSQFRRDPLGVLEALLWHTNSVLAISEHGARSSIYDEGKAVVKKHKATPEEVEMQLTQYRHDGFPDEKRFNGKKALAEASVIVREHTPLTNLFMCLWFNEVVRFTSRDQLSFPYVLRQLRVLKDVNMFPVCTRKDLVNSMGHTRKARSHTN